MGSWLLPRRRPDASAPPSSPPGPDLALPSWAVKQGPGLRRYRRAAAALGVLVGLLVLSLAMATALVRGEALARLVRSTLPAFAGKLEVRAVYWYPRLWLDLLSDRPTPIVVEGLRITDPEGVEVLRAPRLELKVRPRSVIGGRVFLHDVKLGPGSHWRFARMARQDGIGFLAWFKIAGDRPAQPPPTDAPAQPSEFVFQIVNADLDGLDAEFDFPGAWGLLLRDIHAPASLLLQGPFVGWDVQKLVARKGGYLRILDDVLPFDQVEVARVATTRDWPDNIFLDVAAARTGRSTLRARGMFTGIYGYGLKPGQVAPPSGIQMHAEFSDAASALAAVAAHRNIAGLGVGGDGASVSVDLRDAFERLKIDGRIQGLDVSFAGYAANRLRLEFALDLGTPMHLSCKQLAFDSPDGGSLQLTADLLGQKARAALRFSQFGVDSYLPLRLRKTAGGTLQGGLRLDADLAARSVQLDGLDLRLQRRGGGRAPRLVRVVGRGSASPQAARTEGITIQVPGGSITARGRFGMARQVLGLALQATATDLPQLLALAGLPPLARSAKLNLDLQGSVDRPAAQGSLEVHQIAAAGLPPIQALLATFRLEEGTAHLDSLAAEAFGGRIEASGTARLFEGSVSRWLKQPQLALQVVGRQLEVGRLVPGDILRGRVDFTARAEGTPRALRASLSLPPGAQLELMGDPWRLAGVEIESDLRTVNVRSLRLERLAGGRIELAGQMALAGDMRWDVTISELPIAGLPGVKDAGVPVAGRVSGRFQLSGRAERPVLSGDLQLRGVTVRGTALGDGDLRFSPTDAGEVAMEGQLFGRIVLAGTASYGPRGPRVNAVADFRDLVLEELVPEMLAVAEARGRVTGRVGFTLERGRPSLDVRLTALELSAAREASALGTGGARRLSLRNATDIHLEMAGPDLVLHPARLVTDGLECRLAGEVHGERLSAQVSGSINLELLQPFLTDRVEHLGGGVDVSLRLSGTTAHPQAEGNIDIARPIAIKLPTVDPIFTVPAGRIELDPQAIRVNRLALEVAEARLEIEGRAGLDTRQNLSTLDLTLGGEISGVLLEALSGGALAEGSGRARVAAQVQGTAAAPRLTGQVDLKSLGFRLRELGRDVVFENGLVQLSNDALVVRGLTARIDGQGLLTVGEDADGPARVVLKRLLPRPEIGSIHVPLNGRRLSLRASSSVELDDVGFDVDLSGDLQRGLELQGELVVASGRYSQDFTIREVVVVPNINESAVRPFYDGVPLLENLALDLRVRTVGDSFQVQNNLAPELYMVFDLHVGGTLGHPRIAGDVRPTDGRFHVFGVRGNFTLVPNVNHITFVDTKSIAAGETPELNLEAEAQVVDSTSREHVVKMRINGPISQSQIDLSTNTGLSKGQVMLLLLAGRTSEQQTVFGGPSSPTLGANVRTGTDVIGQLSRDSVADFLEPYIDDTLKLITGGSVNLRPTFGPDGFELRLERIGRQLDFQLSLRRGLEGQKQYRAEASLWIWDYLIARGFVEQVTLPTQLGIVEDTPLSARLELTLDFPIRFFLR